MIQTVCDRCKGIIKPYQPIFEISMGLLRPSDDPYEAIEDTDYTNTMHYDFCKDCFIEIRNILNNETTEVIKVNEK